METISKTIKAKKQRHSLDVERVDKQPLESNPNTWPSLITVDLITLSDKPPAAATAIDNPMRQLSTNQNISDRRSKMVALSDGTQVIFAKLGQLTVVQST